MRPLKKQNQSQSVSLPRARGTGTVRIIGGMWRRTPLSIADLNGLRPTGDRVRETLFNWLNHIFGDFAEIQGLDLFAGSGALGFELASRGAQSVTLIEKNKAAYAKLCSVREKLKAESLLDIRCGDCFTLLPSIDKKFDIIFIDPPFAFNLHEKAIKLSLHYLTENGLLYIEAPRQWDVAILSDLQLKVVRQADAGAVTFRLVGRSLEGK